MEQYREGETWGTFAATGDRHWFVKSATGCCEAPAAEATQAANKTSSQAGLGKGPPRRTQKIFTHTVPRDQRRLETRAPFRCVAQSAFATSALSSATTVRAVAFRRCKDSPAHKKTPALEQTPSINKYLRSRPGGG